MNLGRNDNATLTFQKYQKQQSDASFSAVTLS